MVISSPTEKVLIFVAVSNVARNFQSLATALTAEERFEAQVPPTAILDEFTRFKVSKKVSLSPKYIRSDVNLIKSFGNITNITRLRDAENLKEESHSLLKDLAAAINNGLAIVKGEKVPWDAYEISESDTDSDTSNDDLQGNTELKQLLASIKAIVTSLFRLSMEIRDPAPTSQSTSNISIDKSYFEQYDILHVKAKYPLCADYLSDRLSKAISGRRQYLAYREEHHLKLAKNIDNIGFEEPKNSGFAGSEESASNSTKATMLDHQNILERIDDDGRASQTSFATSVNATIRVPSLPKEAAENDFFECPLCFMIVSIHAKKTWKYEEFFYRQQSFVNPGRTHVYRDLHPYCCTFEGCTTADRLGAPNLLAMFRKLWQVIFALKDLKNHVEGQHPDLAQMLPAIGRTSLRGPTLTDEVRCPLCEKPTTLRGLQKHLGAHQQLLALFALPLKLDEKEPCKEEDDEILATESENDEDDLAIDDLSDDDEEGAHTILSRANRASELSMDRLRLKNRYCAEREDPQRDVANGAIDNAERDGLQTEIFSSANPDSFNSVKGKQREHNHPSKTESQRLDGTLSYPLEGIAYGKEVESMPGAPEQMSIDKSQPSQLLAQEAGIKVIRARTNKKLDEELKAINTKREEEEKDLERSMRNKLSQFGFHDDQIQEMINTRKEKEGLFVRKASSSWSRSRSRSDVGRSRGENVTLGK
ncbi:hypothetical protein GQ44DRAFT_759125 [Phaeosphaeriaceae sp. PMI808]|nr:hypothetical protein GQ44DRAFT_759125 [Phaeosphaeriaceae sp. PMI808]